MKKNYCTALIFMMLFICPIILSAQFGGGNGSQSSPYQISIAEHLAELAVNVNNGNTYENKYFELKDNIDLSQWAEQNSASQGWIPIGTLANPFKGKFDGSHYTISGMYINQPDNNMIGLFGCVNNGAKIQNIHLKGSAIIGNDYVGGIIGYAKCNTEMGDPADSISINHCFNYINIIGNHYTGGILGHLLCDNSMGGETSANISSCHNMGNISSSKDSDIGGIIGRGAVGVFGKINIYKCYNNGNIIAPTSNHVGGIAGYVAGDISFNSCANNGDIFGGTHTGGIAGYADNPWGISGITYEVDFALCYSVGNIIGANNIGGIIGYVTKENDYTITLTNNYAASQIISNQPSPENIGGIVGYIGNEYYSTISGNHFDNNLCTYGGEQNGIFGHSTEDMWKSSTFSGWNFAQIANMWNIWENKSYPYFQWQSSPVTDVSTNKNILTFELRNMVDSLVLYRIFDNQRIRVEATGLLNAGVQNMAVNTPLNSDEQTLLITYESGKISSYPVYVKDTPIVGIEHYKDNGADSYVYPNPVSSLLSIKLPHFITNTSYVIFNSSGKLMKYGEAVDEMVLNVESFPAGVYFLTINKPEKKTIKFIKN